MSEIVESSGGKSWSSRAAVRKVPQVPGYSSKLVAPIPATSIRSETPHIHIINPQDWAVDKNHPIPLAPVSLEATNVDREMLKGLGLKLAHTVPDFTTKWMADHLLLTIPVVNEVLEGLSRDGLIETLGSSGFMNFRFAITIAGQQRATSLLQTSSHLGPAPVSLEEYVRVIEKQNAARHQITMADVQAAMADLVLEDDVIKVSGMALSSGRSLFLFGPAGNGKTTLAKALHTALHDTIWIPYSITAYNHIIQILDPKWHHPVKNDASRNFGADRRWV